ncbi:MAG: hypothetical protein R3E39_06620 [Anaerolineae bacterium]
MSTTPPSVWGVLLVDQENLPAWIQHRLLQFSAEDQLPLHIYANRGAPFNLEDQTAFAQVVAYHQNHRIGLLILDHCGCRIPAMKQLY